ncbi:MAG: hypothetical protein E5X60_17280, partial [Mesorhizobium sp.]
MIENAAIPALAYVRSASDAEMCREFCPQFALVSEVAGRKVHRHGMFNTGKPGDRAGFSCREMALRGGQLAIFLQEARFD